jgi:RNA polymerase sigma-70 factor (ECF subfamily)
VEGSASHAQFKALIEAHGRAVYNFSFRMCLDKQRASEMVESVFLRAYIGQESLPAENKVRLWLFHIANHLLEEKLDRAPEVSFDLLDETLRSEATRTDVVRSLTEPRRDFLLWELKQGCMTSVVNCLSPGERAAFVLANILKLSDEDAVAILGITMSAYKVRLSRGQKKISDYLAPRCEHVDPMNPCRCPARVGVALAKGFIKQSGEVSLRNVEPFGRYGSGAQDEPLRDVAAIYGNLPEPDLPDGFESQLVASIDNGAWDRVRDKKLSGK